MTLAIMGWIWRRVIDDDEGCFVVLWYSGMHACMGVCPLSATRKKNANRTHLFFDLKTPKISHHRKTEKLSDQANFFLTRRSLSLTTPVL